MPESPCFSSAGHVDVMDVTLGMLSACLPLSHRHGYPPMGTHCHSDGLKGWIRICSLNVLSIRPEFDTLFTAWSSCSAQSGRYWSSCQWNYKSEINATSQIVVIWTLWYGAVKPHSSGFLGRVTQRVWINSVWLKPYVFVMLLRLQFQWLIFWVDTGVCHQIVIHCIQFNAYHFM